MFNKIGKIAQRFLMPAVVVAVGLSVYSTVLVSAQGTVTYYGCNSNGTLKQVGTSQPNCKQGDTLMTWNQVGPMGPVGAKGDQGDKGDTGDTGPQGLQGPKGDKGDTGDTGAQGPQGLQGVQGDVGPQGPQGPVGVSGWHLGYAEYQISPKEWARVDAKCKPGEKVLGGGFMRPDWGVEEVSSWPAVVDSNSGPVWAWSVIFHSDQTGVETEEAYAICAAVN